MILFRQTRVGRNGVPFTLYKFETMRDGIVTRPLMRRLGIDELPQLVNVMRGEMSLFGPRPELPAIHERASATVGEVWDERLRVKPGIISLAAVGMPELRGATRYDTEAKRHQAVLDNTMIDNMSLGMRWRMLRRLPRVILRGQTA